MKRLFLVSVAAFAAVPAFAQPTVPAPLTAPINGVRLDVVATGEVTRVPDQVTISAGVTSRAPQAQAALRDNAAQMERVRAALRRLGIADRDIQTGTISLNQDYERSPEGARPSGYVASNQLNIRFRDVANAGRIIDALVAEGVNNVQGPMFGLANRDGAVDEARTRAIGVARARADQRRAARRRRDRRSHPRSGPGYDQRRSHQPGAAGPGGASRQCRADGARSRRSSPARNRRPRHPNRNDLAEPGL